MDTGRNAFLGSLFFLVYALASNAASIFHLNENFLAKLALALFLTVVAAIVTKRGYNA